MDHTFAVREPAEGPVEVFGLMNNVGGMPGIVLTRAFSSERTRTAAPRRLVPSVRDQPMESALRSLGPIRDPMSQCFGDNALVAYDLGIAPAAALEVLAQLIVTSAPEVHAWLRGVFDEFRMASGLAPEIDLVPHLGHGIAVGLLPAEADLCRFTKLKSEYVLQPKAKCFKLITYPLQHIAKPLERSGQNFHRYVERFEYGLQRNQYRRDNIQTNTKLIEYGH